MKKKIILIAAAAVMAAAGMFGIAYAVTVTLIEDTPVPIEEIITVSAQPVTSGDTETEAATDAPEPAEPTATAETQPLPEPIEIPVDFAALQAENPDIYSWITIPDTPIDFPVLQSATDNTLYLRHNTKKEYNINGAIYSENYNSTDYSDYMTVLYGHTMKSGVMFTPLLQYMDNVFFGEHRSVIVYTPDARRTYTVFAAYEYDSRHLLLNMDFTSRRVRGIYLDFVMNQTSMTAQIADDTEVTADDRILTLSCCNMEGTKRFLVQAVLTEEAFTD